MIEIGVLDSDGREHRVTERAHVLPQREFTRTSAFPAELWLRADAGTVTGEHVRVTLADSVETTEGLTELSVAAKDVRWL